MGIIREKFTNPEIDSLASAHVVCDCGYLTENVATEEVRILYMNGSTLASARRSLPVAVRPQPLHSSLVAILSILRT